MGAPDPASNDQDQSTSKPAPAFDLSTLSSMIPGQQKVSDNVSDTPDPPPEGPIIVNTNPQPDLSPPEGDNGAPRARLRDLEPPPEPIDFQNILMNILFLIVCGFAIYYGWGFGQEFGRGYLLYWQSWGPWWRSWFTSRQIPTK